MAFADAARPLAMTSADERVSYLKRVLIWTTGGLSISAATGIGMAVFLYVAASMGATFLFNQWFSLIVILGGYGVAQYVAPRMVFGTAQVPGFLLGAVAQGVSMGYLLLSAFLMGASTGNPFGLVGMAFVLTGLTGVGMTAYVWTGPREFKMLGAGLAALGMPMLLLMGVSFVFPSLFGGVIGIGLSALFVVISAGGLLYQVNQVMHKLRTDQHIEGAFMITMGLLILYWNILVLIMRLQRR